MSITEFIEAKDKSATSSEKSGEFAMMASHLGSIVIDFGIKIKDSEPYSPKNNGII